MSKKFKYLQSTFIKNSLWGVLSNIFQILFVSLFFAILARKYQPDEFAKFLISNTVYQILAAFSSMGLGQWFIREHVKNMYEDELTNKFMKMQLGLGGLFYGVNIVIALLLYRDAQIQILCVLLGTNIIFDNLINAIKTLNIAENRQQKTATVLAIDGLLKVIVAGMLFIYPFSTAVLSVLVVAVRLVTLSLFIQMGSANTLSVKSLWKAKVSYADLKNLVISNWRFIVISSISIIYWKLGNVIISKSMPLQNVADYEIAFRIFSVLQIIPVVASGTIYPQFIKYYNERNFNNLRFIYTNIFNVYTLFAIISYAFIYAFAPIIIPLVFGNGYPGAVACLQQMFLTFLLMPTVLLQANLLVAMRLERLDMRFNIISLLINICGCVAGLLFVRKLAVINYAVLGSFVVFHILQDVVLVRRKLITIAHCLSFYGAILAAPLICIYGNQHLNPYLFFGCALAVVGLIALYLFGIFKKKANLNFPDVHLNKSIALSEHNAA
ncbi:oligosaccharide flippase family protein [Mucilaginibacter sp. RS28]|uniref:Oligosaccharide flippase family protein n=1 Tax=Mucilaginibacter straminoryzae TaxID=2932774 RepID=A0A9X1X4X7_9SPHI|nr:oligosaccharide flippase family protein [Mucilaginibacter straminoryzae]MCJ8211013.1 oligosaccharide flippase family protein [Mucilaginibacter straminoryzae]